MGNSTNNKELFEYYDERAPEYEEFYWGSFPAKIPNPDLYKNDTITIQKLLPDYISGECIDIACGTGFWLPFYQHNCSQITLIDQSQTMLAECAQKIEKLGIESKTETIGSDFFKHPFRSHKYDSALIGFLLSHLNEDEGKEFFLILKGVLKQGGTFVIIDNVWSQEIAAAGRPKAGRVSRSLSDGRKFKIFKKYFERQDLDDLAAKYDIELGIIYWGRIFFLATGNFPRG
jgi:ubiquinone/menaquinone biosynthesis C-methylase UbiE